MYLTDQNERSIVLSQKAQQSHLQTRLEQRQRREEAFLANNPRKRRTSTSDNNTERTDESTMAKSDNKKKLEREVNDLKKKLKQSNTALKLAEDNAGILQRQIDEAVEAENLAIESQETVEKLTKDNETLTSELDSVRGENQRLKTKLGKALQALKESGKAADFEQSDTVRGNIKEWIREYGFFKTKFARDEHSKGKSTADKKKDTPLVVYTKKVYQGIKEKCSFEKEGDSQLTDAEFVRIYKGYVTYCLSQRRQFVQTQALNAVIGTLNFVSWNKMRVLYAYFFDRTLS